MYSFAHIGRDLAGLGCTQGPPFFSPRRLIEPNAWQFSEWDGAGGRGEE